MRVCVSVRVCMYVCMHDIRLKAIKMSRRNVIKLLTVSKKLQSKTKILLASFFSLKSKKSPKNIEIKVEINPMQMSQKFC